MFCKAQHAGVSLPLCSENLCSELHHRSRPFLPQGVIKGVVRLNFVAVVNGERILMQCFQLGKMHTRVVHTAREVSIVIDRARRHASFDDRCRRALVATGLTLFHRLFWEPSSNARQYVASNETRWCFCLQAALKQYGVPTETAGTSSWTKHVDGQIAVSLYSPTLGGAPRPLVWLPTEWVDLESNRASQHVFSSVRCRRVQTSGHWCEANVNASMFLTTRHSGTPKLKRRHVVLWKTCWRSTDSEENLALWCCFCVNEETPRTTKM